MHISQRKLLALAAALAMVSTAHAAPGLVNNGGFEVNGGTGQLGSISSASGWSTSSGTFAFVADTTADDATFGMSGGFASQYSAGAGTHLFVWGPDNGVNNGFSPSSNGGYFLAADGSYATGAVKQTITGLTVGHTYELTFEWAGAQLTDSMGAFEVGWQVSFGSESESVGGAVPSRGFMQWNSVGMSFTAAATTQELSFLATGTTGMGAMALLDGVALADTTPAAPVPEPQTYALMLAGLGVLGAVARRRQAR